MARRGVPLDGPVPGGTREGLGGWLRASPRPATRPVSDVLVVTATATALALAALGLLSTLTRRRTGLAHLVTAALLEAVLVVQAVLAVVRLVAGERPPDTPTFAGYLAGTVLLPVAGMLWARSEPSRWAGTVVAVTALVTVVLLWRLVQLWEAPGA